MTQTVESTVEGRIPERPTLLHGVWAFLAVGIGVAIYLVQHKLRISLDPTFESACNLGGAINCDKVNTSDWSTAFGLPIALFAIPTYAVLAYLVLQAKRAVGSTDEAVVRSGKVALNAATAIATLTVLHSAWLAYVSSTKVGAWCLFCMSLYAVNLGSLLLLAKAGGIHPVTSLRTSLKALADFVPPVLPAMGVAVISGGLAWAAYDIGSERMEDSYKAMIDAQFAGAIEVPPSEESEAVESAGAAVSASDAPAAASANAVRSPAARPATAAPSAPRAPSGPRTSWAKKMMSPDLGVRKGKATENGWPFFQTPLDEEGEWFYGNPQATVTVVKFADFQCTYCRYLALSMHPVMEKYKDRVRFVMKNFPMNVKCNQRMAGYDKHPNACEAAWAGHCAGMQGKFWEMHDEMYRNQEQLDEASLRKQAEKVGLDLAAYDSCMVSPETKEQIANDIRIAFRAGINGTPRTYVNGVEVGGAASSSILEYYLEKALEAPLPIPGEAAVAPAAAANAPKPDGTQMIEAKKGSGSFWIDPYEGAISQDGRAVHGPDLVPAEVSWYDAKAACEKAGKRLCTEEEWVSACTGTPAVDNNKNTFFADDEVEGNMYPYGPFYNGDACHDQADKYEGKAVPSGRKEMCRTPSGIYDLAGNIGEWVNADEQKAVLVGGYASSGDRAACNQRSSMGQAGRRNQTTGFRCCADTNVKSRKASAEDLKTTDGEVLGKPAPAFDVETTEGSRLSQASFKGKVTLISFFASWCGPCKKEFPYLVKHQEAYKAKGFQVFAIGVDDQPDRSVSFAKEYNPNFPIVTDPDSKLMGIWGVFSMPATFLVDREGVVRYSDIGFKPEEQAAKLKQAIEGLL